MAEQKIAADLYARVFQSVYSKTGDLDSALVAAKRAVEEFKQ